jgi:hypothetical protein
MTALTLIMPGTAVAATSTVTITQATGDDDGVDIRGRVTSSAIACKRNRRVEVWHDVDPPGPSDMDFLLGHTLTNNKGRWRLSSSFFPDKVYAVVKQKRTCKADRSPRATVDFDD